MTSIEIAEVTGKLHKDVMKAIRNMEPAWGKVNGRNFALVEYRDKKGESLPSHPSTSITLNEYKPPPTPPKEGGRATTNQQKNRPVRVKENVYKRKEMTYISGKK